MGMGGPGMGMGGPGMGMGGGMGMQPYGYRNQNWNGYNLHGSYNIPEMWVIQNGPMAFQCYDRNGTGTLDMMELPGVLNYVFQQLGNPPPDMNDVFYCMYKFDANGDGRINLPEFQRMLHFMAGRIY